jgi:hypothetical protein
MNKVTRSNLPQIGYLYHYPHPDHPTNKFRMDIFIASTPTEHHFDVLRAHFCTKNAQESLTELIVIHPWTYEQSAHVCAGVIMMEDRKGKKEEAFTFGGQLTIAEQESQTVCRLVSTAPILEISGASSLQRFFIEEIEAILAMQRARYAELQTYEKKLCKADPFKLYQACLEELTKKLESFQHKDENYRQLLIYLHSQQHRLAAAGLAEEPILTLEEIFG